MSGTLGVDTADICGIVEYAKAVALEHVHKLHKAHIEAHVGLVAAVVFHGVGPCHAQERLVELDAAYFLEQVFCHAFEQVDDVVLFNEAHLAVDLCEFGLAVGTQVLVAEALHNLEVAVHTADHQELFERLGRLGQSIELSGIHARGHNEVAGAFGGRANQHRCLNF